MRADGIQSDLEELLKALAERCKKHSVEVKSSALIELPPGNPVIFASFSYEFIFRWPLFSCEPENDIAFMLFCVARSPMF